MNRYAIQHIVDSAYCFPVSQNEIVLRLRTAKDDIKKAYVIYESKYVIGEKQKKAEMTKGYTGELFDYFTIKLKLNDTRLAYVFYVNDGEDNYYFSEDGVTKSYDFSIGYFNFFQYPFINKADIMEVVPWMKNAVFYEIFVDRFHRGCADKDLTYINCKWGDIPTPHTFAGGDLKGITEKLDYLRSLGINALYLTPIFQSKSNHKYDIIDYYKIDEQFGTNEDLKELVDRAHGMGIRVVLDAVFNHCSEHFNKFQDVVKKGKASRYSDWFIIHGDKPDKALRNYETFSFCDYMPKFNTSNDEVQQYLIQMACHYITEYNIDGWRLDVSDEVSHDFWRKFRKAVKKVKKDAVIIGENWHDACSYLRGDQYDSIMNYAFTKGCLDYFVFGTFNAVQFANKLNDILMRNNDLVNSMMLNLLDSHDTHRFYSLVAGDKEKVKAALCLMYLFPGAPCVYYGTEILLPGGSDPDCRRCMDWEKANAGGNEIAELMRKLARLRQDYSLSDGRIKIYSQNNIFILKIQLQEAKIELYINNTDKDSAVDGINIKRHSHRIYLNDTVYEESQYC
ncbi:MAG: Neopullulanase / Cyclomaltodextrinase / Maltogenic alpha-amylase [Lachnoclostridium sp.]